MVTKKTFNKEKGDVGEVLAISHLLENGFTLLETNYKCSYGEIDIIASKKSVIHFIEVKYRRSKNFGLGREAVGPAKQKTIRNVALKYLQARRLYDEVDISFDVIDIVGDVADFELEHMEGCF